ncbi:hypothetical protein [Rhizobium sp. RU36D]|uniref:hypothetical protein n=1 Tax=Rhizobium sp. RU36D TaxID=1907415 RepID=UPI000A0599AA|nr:hypothetical protein [Rhizobium sp. RU36D]
MHPATKALIFFMTNCTYAILMMANGCGYFFSQGENYADGQECASYLELTFGITYFSQSSPLIILDELLLLVIINTVVALAFPARGPKVVTVSVSIAAIFLGIAMPFPVARLLSP